MQPMQNELSLLIVGPRCCCAIFVPFFIFSTPPLVTNVVNLGLIKVCLTLQQGRHLRKAGGICPPDFLKCQCFDEIGVLDSRKIRK